MEDLSVDPSPAELALIEAELPEWERLAVRDYWDAVVAEEITEVPVSVNAPEPRPFMAQELKGGGQPRNFGGASVLRFPGDRAPMSGNDAAAA